MRVDLDGRTAGTTEVFDMGARVRAVEEGPDGAIWVLEDEGAGRAAAAHPGLTARDVRCGSLAARPSSVVSAAADAAASVGSPNSVRTPGLKATWSGGREASPARPTDAISPSSRASSSAS